MHPDDVEQPILKDDEEAGDTGGFAHRLVDGGGQDLERAVGGAGIGRGIGDGAQRQGANRRIRNRLGQIDRARDVPGFGPYGGDVDQSTV